MADAKILETYNLGSFKGKLPERQKGSFELTELVRGVLVEPEIFFGLLVFFILVLEYIWKPLMFFVLLYCILKYIWQNRIPWAISS